MRLYIAEKPSVARLLAATLGDGKQEGQHIKLTNGDIVAWAAGHLLEQAEPAAYGDQWVRWNIDSLPILPQQWKMNVRSEVKDLFKSIQGDLKDATEVVNVGDADREGQLLIDEILQRCRYKGPVKRLLITDTTETGIRNALASMTPNEAHRGAAQAAQARSRADWLHGMNGTRAFTCLAQKGGYRGNALRIGRVKTPVTALVVRRDLEIEHFVPKPYWVLKAQVSVPSGTYSAVWKPTEDQVGLDDQNRLIDPTVRDDLVARLNGAKAEVQSVEVKHCKAVPPLGYSLPRLQIDASKRFGLSPEATLKICQGLYEAQMLTYPRSDCVYAPEALKLSAEDVLLACGKVTDLVGRFKGGLSLSRTAPVWNTAKVAEHYAILPTACPAPKALSSDEKKIYELVVTRYLAFFMSDYEYEQTLIVTTIDGETFHSKGKRELQQGWKVLTAKIEDEDDSEEKKSDEEEEEDQALPELKQGDSGTASVQSLDKETKAPKRFTEASLLAAMNGIHKFVSSPEIKKILKETDGIGTAATQAKIIADLETSGLLIKEKKSIKSSPSARALIAALPERITLPDMTALWEMKFRQLETGKATFESVLDEITGEIVGMIDEVKHWEKPFDIPSMPTESKTVKKTYGGTKKKVSSYKKK